MTDGSGGFSFDLLGIGGVLKKNQLAMPPHQREFSWDAERVTQLIEDLTEAKETSKDHFLGTIVAIKDGDRGVLKIVDGQQRLTTTTILLSAIRNFLQSDASATLTVEAIESEFLSTIDRRAQERIPRLSLNVDDNEFFKNLIAAKGDFNSLHPSRESHDLLIHAARTCEAWVARVAATHASSDVKNRLNDWLEYLENSATVVLLSVSDGSRAYKMFETLNDRGLRTSQADLVKSYLFGEVGDSRLPEAQAKWSSMRETLQELDDDDRTINFLWHSVLATRKFIKADDLYDTISDVVRGGSNAAAYLDELERLARIYVATYHHTADRWHEVGPSARKALETINFFNPKPMRPLLLGIAAKMPDSEIEGCLSYLVSVTVRSVIVGSTRSGTIQDTYASAALGTYSGRITTLEGLKVALAGIAVPDSDFKESFATAKSSKAALARYYLHSLESAQANEAEPWYIQNDDPSQITLEHILPQKLDGLSEWSHISEEDHRRSIKRLGNLCLLQKTRNSNKPNDFQSGKAIYSAAPYKWTNMLAAEDKWGIDEIEARQQAMAELAVKTWAM
ncbi:DUF262 domain-containing protein [Sulfitobacter sp. 1A12126]|uniref:DUF262 domain-containing protein n=1 Tax=Sulfitobacter sp. 1A12126 TaxID=3368591 RepID=UPI00374707C3